MDAQQIKTFIDAMAASDLDEMEIGHGGWTLRLTRRSGGASAPAAAAGPVPVAPVLSGAETVPADKPAAVPAAPAAAPASTEVPAPLYGVVHLQKMPGEPPFVAAGQTVEPGQVLCVIEAMKVFHEVRAEHGGTVAEVRVANGQEVEAGQPLLRLV